MLDKPFVGTIVTQFGNDFSAGYHAGYLDYIVRYKGRGFTDKEVYNLLSGTINSVQHSCKYSAGFVLGWSAALQRDYPVPSLVVVVES